MSLSRLCWGCGTQEGQAATFKCCPKCRELKIISAYFCSDACFEANWKRHKKWHKQHAQVAKLNEDNACKDFNEEEKRSMREGGDPYYALIEKAISSLRASGNHSLAAKRLRRAIELCPDRSAAYHNLGMQLSESHDLQGAAAAFLQAAERQSDTLGWQWADSVSLAFNKFCDLEQCRDAPKPPWWTDEGLLRVSKQVTAEGPAVWGGWYMRAIVLVGSTGAVRGAQELPWHAGARTAVDVLEAAQAYDHALRLCSSGGLAAHLKSSKELCCEWARTRLP